MSTDNKTENNNRVYYRTDLACETDAAQGKSNEGTSYDEYEQNGVKVALLAVENDAGERATGKPRGKYYTIFCGKTWLLSDSDREGVILLIRDIINDMVVNLTGKQSGGSFDLLVVGLGNRFITADAVGPLTLDKITVTRHLRTENHDLFERIGCAAVAASAPGVLAQTGIETSETVKQSINASSPDAVILIDALAARSPSRLASTIQISDTGIYPGSGIGNKRSAITRETLGVPVISIGVPTVVDSSTLVYDALTLGGIDTDNISDKLREVLENGRSFFVSPKDSDVIADEMSGVIASAVNRFVGTE